MERGSEIRVVSATGFLEEKAPPVPFLIIDGFEAIVDRLDRGQILETYAPR